MSRADYVAIQSWPSQLDMMNLSRQRRWWVVCVLITITGFFFYLARLGGHSGITNDDDQPLGLSSSESYPVGVEPPHILAGPKAIDWTTVRQHHPVTSFIPLPSGKPAAIPPIQKAFGSWHESTAAKAKRKQRLDAVKEEFQHAWSGYRTRAWLKDELRPLSGAPLDTFGGRAATLVDSLDTLWIMGLWDDFEDAVRGVATIDFSTFEEATLNVFETTIRYLGGLLGAYDISGSRYPVLLEKAVDLGNMLYTAFDTPNRMPVTRWDWNMSAEGNGQEASESVLVSELTSLSLEFTRLAQLTGDDKFFDAIHRVTNELDRAQNMTKLPGMWPVVVNARLASFSDDNTFTLGGMSDSLYEYLLKVRQVSRADSRS